MTPEQDPMEKDRLFAEKQERVKPFSFTREVAGVFDDMLVRSVPLYRESIQRQARMALDHFREGTRIYDLGCSHGNLGVLILALFRQKGKQPAMVGVDTSLPMLEKFRGRLDRAGAETGIDLVCCPMEDIAIENASVVIINLTLQFLDVQKRDRIIQKIYEGLVPGGILLLTEKILDSDPGLENLHQDFYRRFKRENGYSDLEISQKRDALEKVLVPEPLETHFQRLANAGFGPAGVWLKWFNFAAMIAVKHTDSQ